MEDRTLRGFVAGVIGGVTATILGHLSYILGINTLRATDWTSILLYAHEPPFSIGEQLLALFILIGWCGAIGSMFAFFILRVTKRHILFKGWMLGTTPFFVIYLLTTLFRVQGTVPIPFSTALSNYITTSIFGVAMAYSFNALDLAITQNRSSLELLAHPATKPSDSDKRQHRPNNEEKDEDSQSNRT